MKIFKIVLLSLTIGSLYAQDEKISFENISAFSGLSSSQAKCIFQDSDGYLWIGTRGEGTYRYDGFSFTVFKNEPENPNSLIHNNVFSIAEDSIGNIWVATQGGISKFEKNKNEFINYNLHDTFEELSGLNWHSAYEVFVDSRNRIWVATSYHGALLFNEEKNEFKHIPQITADSIDVLPQVYGDFTEDDNGIIWAAGGGLRWYDENDSLFRPAPGKSKDFELLKSKDAFRAVTDSENNIWVATTTDLYKYVSASNDLIHLKSYGRPNAISGGHEAELVEDSEGTMWFVHTNLAHPLVFPNLGEQYTILNTIKMTPAYIFVDSFGSIWICDWFNSLYKHVPTKQNFYQIKQGDQTIWGTSGISAIYQPEAQPELLFVSADEYGRSDLKSYNWKTGQVKSYNISDVSVLTSKNDDTYWLGTWGKGLFEWNVNKNRLKPYFSDISKNPNLSEAKITNLTKDDKGNIWIGTLNGLYRMKSDENELELIIEGHGITCTYLDEDIMWIGVWNNGVIKYNFLSKGMEKFRYDKSSNSLSNNVVWDIYRDKEGFLWLATEGGLNRFDLRTNEFEVFTEANGLGSNHIAAILPDQYGSIWLSTGSGISRLQKDSKNRVSFSNYNAMDGLLNPNFHHALKLKDSLGRLFFGGNRGLYYFTPKKRKSNPPITHIADLMINGKSISNSNTIDFNQFKNGESTLELDHDQNTLSFKFIALHFAQPSQNRFSYYLEGYESDWQFSKQREMQYVNLEPGSYNFHLRTANRDGIWSSEEITLPINISKPWWNTWYAYILYFSLFLFGLIGLRQFELNRRKENENKKLLEAENKRKTEELEEARSLQLSMLPKELPQLPNLDIAVYMKTATEVGGDYYDFHVALDGTLTVVIGDATGHGMKAGTMVTTAKSLFNSYAPNPDILFSFQEITRCIKQMNFGKLSMCMTMLKIKGEKMQISTAGMPPSFIFRRDTRVVEEHLFKAMPLGTMLKFPYEIKDTTLKPGDTILLMSDGLPELENGTGEMYGYKRIRNGFEDVAEKAPEDIISFLKNEGSNWTDHKDPDDDVTFVVIKVK